MIPCPSQHRPKPADRAFTIVEVMVAAMILVVGFMGMITAITIGSEMLATARRQTIAAQLIIGELDRLRLESWATISALPTTTTWASGNAYVAGATCWYGGGSFQCVQAHTSSASSTPPTSNSWVANMTYDAATTYHRGDVVKYSVDGLLRRYTAANASSGNAPTSATYWKPYLEVLPSTGVADGVSFALTRTVLEVIPNELREITITVTWTKSGSTAAAPAASGSWLDRVTFYQPSTISRNYTRSMSTMIGKYGLNQAYQR